MRYDPFLPEKIYDMNQAGKMDVEIAKKLRLNPDRVGYIRRKYCSENGVDWRRNKRGQKRSKLDPTAPNFFSRIRHCQTQKQIAEEFGCCQGLVSYFLKTRAKDFDFGYDVCRYASWRYEDKSHLDKAVLRLHNRKVSMNSIAKRSGVTSRRVRVILKKFGKI